MVQSHGGPLAGVSWAAPRGAIGAAAPTSRLEVSEDPGQVTKKNG